MKMKKSSLVVMLFIFCLVSSKTTYAEGGDSNPRLTYEYGYPQPFAVGIHAGTAGFGLQIYKPISKEFGARLGFSHMPFSTNILGNYSNRELSTDISAKSTNISLLFGWTPFVKNGGFFRSFSVQLGGAYFTQLNGSLKSKLRDPYKFGDIMVDPELVGTINTDVQWKKTINPYAGIGWTNIVIDNKFSLNVDLGMYYLSKPSVSMAATGLLAENVNNASIIEENIKSYRFLPRVEVGISYRFGKLRYK
ncbi:hypothetical protein [Sphingobacterium rhinopitheci]|uniref:hypothetical protein n=1 Tax=Sphingobacterium rhinopitheci TaxID=2781960 RepID=UPI001F524478|nr:hypothetical protein [Sphingobacterium rhinopitheci]MCI0922710.1 hypothetical protein [Sphingobacterium rhinopitheci]